MEGKWERHRHGRRYMWLKDLDEGRQRYTRWLAVAWSNGAWHWECRGPRLSWVHGKGTARTALGARLAADWFAGHHVADVVCEYAAAQDAAFDAKIAAYNAEETTPEQLGRGDRDRPAVHPSPLQQGLPLRGLPRGQHSSEAARARSR